MPRVRDKVSDGWRLVRLRLYQADAGSLDFIVKAAARRGLSLTKSDAVRYAIAQQALLDRTYGVPGRASNPVEAEAARPFLGVSVSQETYHRVTGRVRASVGWDRRGRTMPSGESVTESAVKFYREDDKAAARVAKLWELVVFGDVVRLSIRVQAALAGYLPPGGVWEHTPPASTD